MVCHNIIIRATYADHNVICNVICNGSDSKQIHVTQGTSIIIPFGSGKPMLDYSHKDADTVRVVHLLHVIENGLSTTNQPL